MQLGGQIRCNFASKRLFQRLAWIGSACRATIRKGFGSINQLAPLRCVDGNRTIPAAFRADADGQIAALVRQMRSQHDSFLDPETKPVLKLHLERDTFETRLLEAGIECGHESSLWTDGGDGLVLSFAHLSDGDFTRTVDIIRQTMHPY